MSHENVLSGWGRCRIAAWYKWVLTCVERARWGSGGPCETSRKISGQSCVGWPPSNFSHNYSSQTNFPWVWPLLNGDFWYKKFWDKNFFEPSPIFLFIWPVIDPFFVSIFLEKSCFEWEFEFLKKFFTFKERDRLLKPVKRNYREILKSENDLLHED